MLIEFDPAKDAGNRAKHGIGLGDYALMAQELTIEKRSPRHGEQRSVKVGPIAGRLHVAVVTYRGETTRVISLRRANARERELYEEATR